ncbi:hypothetical protein NDU88_000125 [Pleurodeles waltl]|uniref:Uncharacterized protein n=1 Tax=Pleurodeles waltl TaxID=8319 RepID=A0AAV7VVL7_PLEWA|nr:hypothetical protein NDU88_000125 [Pleurodeles waltl]
MDGILGLLCPQGPQQGQPVEPAAPAQRPRRPVVAPRTAFPKVKKRGRGQETCSDKGQKTWVIPEMVPGGSTGRGEGQGSSVIVAAVQNCTSCMAIGVTTAGGAGQSELVTNLASVLPWLSKVGVLSAPLMVGALEGIAEIDHLERARRLVAHLDDVVGQGMQWQTGMESAPVGAAGGSVLAIQVEQGSVLAGTSHTGSVLQAVLAAVGSLPFPKESTRAGTLARLLSIGLGDVCSQHNHLGRHLWANVKEKIWKVSQVAVCELTVDRPEWDESKQCKECSHSKECGHWCYKKKVEETLLNGVKGFKISRQS